MWPCCIVTNFFIIKPTRCTNFPNLHQHETLHVLGSSSAHHQEFIHCTLGTGICHKGLKTAFEQDHPGPARKLSSNLYDIYHRHSKSSASLEARTVYGDCTVCSCRHSKSSASLEASTVYGDCTVCSCRHSKSSASLEARTVYGDRTVCSCRHSKSSTSLEARTVYGDCTVCSCRHSKSSASLEARTVYGDCTVCSCRHSKSSTSLEARTVCSCRYSKSSASLEARTVYGDRTVYKPVWHKPSLSVQWINSWWWAEKLPKTCRISCQNKFGKLVHLVGFIIKKLATYILACSIISVCQSNN